MDIMIDFNDKEKRKEIHQLLKQGIEEVGEQIKTEVDTRTLEALEKLIETQERIIEDQEERIAIMTEHGLWIPVEKQLPEEGKFVLVYGELYPNEREGCKVAVSRRIDFNYWIGLGRERKVTHWMPTPEPPKEGDV